MRQPKKILRRLSLAIAAYPNRHVLDVEGALAQIKIVSFTERVCVIRRHFLENELDVAKIGLELPQHLVNQRPVFHHEEMRVEDAGVLRADRLRDALLHFENLRARLDEGGLEPADLVRDFGSLDPMFNDIV